MIYRVTMMSGTEIAIESEEALASLVAEVNKGTKLVVTKYGIINAASISDITEYYERNRELAEQMRYGKTLPQAHAAVMGDSPFAKLLAPQKAMLDNKGRTQIQEQTGRKGAKA